MLTIKGPVVDEPTGKVFVTEGGGPSSGQVLMFPAATNLHQPDC
ncbi:MAG TPA: hypothetical protein VN837_11250 [Chloroflexota bacterium]|nr:hypothetical protein [Chloroflexota bacterium]